MKTVSNVIENIRDYDDYRLFLRDYFEEQKKRTRNFTQRYFAQKAGFNSHSFCGFVIRGERNLTEKSSLKMLKGMGLKGKDAQYFDTLVHLNQAVDPEEQDKYFRILQRLRQSSDFYKPSLKQHRFFEEWYYPVLLNLATQIAWKGDFGLLGSKVYPPLTAYQTERGIRNLIEMGLLEQTKKGDYLSKPERITNENVPTLVKQHARRQVLILGMQAVEKLGPKERYTTYSTVHLDKNNYLEAMRILEEARSEILSLSNLESNFEELYQVVIQAFPVTQNKEERK